VPAMRKWQQHWLAGVLLLLSLALGWTVLRPVTAFAAPTGSSDFVKYYVVVSSYQGRPENLGEIATRFLGTAQRAQDIFELNSGRVQSDGGKLTDPNTLHKGWRLILPWDAVGSGVQYGALPSATPTAPASPSPGSTSVGTAPGGSGPGPSQPANPDAAKCAGTSRSPNSPQDQWATLRLAPDHAWTYTRGAGVTVAVVDSGVDASLPALSGRVTEGTDIVSGTGRGDTDCLGSGTVMASIVAARSDQGGGSVTGVAPDATILPVRLVTTNSRAGSADQVAAIQFAVSAGAKVIALGSFVTPSDPAVAAAIAQASSHDAVVVMAAPSDSAQPAPLASAASAPVLRVGGVGIDGTLTKKYATSIVDVVAPGKQVAGLGISGTGQVAASGTQYAVAFVAGEAALVRARFPGLTNEQVIRRIEATADRIGNSSPDPQFGWGLIDPGVSVTRVIPDEGRVAAPPAPVRGPGLDPGPRMAAIGIIAVVSLAALILLMLRLRWIIRPSSASPPPATTVGEEPTPAEPVVKRIGSIPSPSTLDDVRSTAPEPTWTGSDGASSARGIPVPAVEQRTPLGLATSSAVPPDLGTGERGSGERA
jgi:membrane-anchored mycosin MYCP